MDEVLVVEPRVIGKKKLGIVCYYRTVEVVIASALVYIVTHAGVEYEIHLLVEKILYMAVSQLCRVADRIRRNGVLSLVVDFTGAFARYDDSESQRCEKHMPERELFIESQSKGKSHNSTVFSGLMCLDEVEKAVVFVFVKVGYLVLHLYAAAFFTAVA